MSSSQIPGNTAARDSGIESPGRTAVLREKLQLIAQESKPRLGLSATELSQNCPTVDTFFDEVATERLRRMPRNGSRLDGVLRRASRLAFAVGSLRDAVGGILVGIETATTLIWGSCLLLLQVRILSPSSDQANESRVESTMSNSWTVSLADTAV